MARAAARSRCSRAVRPMAGPFPDICVGTAYGRHELCLVFSLIREDQLVLLRIVGLQVASTTADSASPLVRLHVFQEDLIVTRERGDLVCRVEPGVDVVQLALAALVAFG